MDKKIRIGAVSYLNTKPLLYGLTHSDLHKDIELMLDYPAAIANGLILDKIDIGLVPVAIIPGLAEYHIVSDYGIGCDGPVKSVCIFSDLPLEHTDSVLLDYQSRTSVELAKILFEHYWKISPLISDTNGEEYIHRIGGKTAGLVIGDRALELRHKYPYIYDLGEAWKNYTGLGFIFAAWVSNKHIDPSFLASFKAANELGLQHLPEIISENQFPYFDLHDYYTQYISYFINDEKRKGLDLFLKMLIDRK